MQKLKGIRVQRDAKGEIRLTPLYHGKAGSTIKANAQATSGPDVQTAMEALGAALVAKGILRQ